MELGKKCIKFFSLPNENKQKNKPADNPALWAAYLQYNRADVLVEKDLAAYLAPINFPDIERKIYALDQEINEKGALVDIIFAQKAAELDDLRKQKALEHVEKLGINPNSTKAMKDFALSLGYFLPNIQAETVAAALEDEELPEKIRVILEARTAVGKNSTSKYKAILNSACSDRRCRGLFQYYGAHRTGRWAGRLVQVQNLPQNHLSALEDARAAVLTKDAEYIELVHGEVPKVLSQLIRTAFVAPQGKTLVVVDFSAIEARIIAWLAEEEWRLEVFKTHGKIYEASAAMMFKIPIEGIKKNSPERQKGKVAELALGYQGGANSLALMGAEKMGLSSKEQEEIVAKWRAANQKIVALWYAADKAALKTVNFGVPTQLKKGVNFSLCGDFLAVLLPSGRSLYYYSPKIITNKFGNLSVCFKDMPKAAVSLIDMYGGKWVQNCVQAIARDCLAHAMCEVRCQLGELPVLHVHDELVYEIDEKKAEDFYSAIVKILAEPIPWAQDLPLKAEGFLSKIYKKE
jgi:DNA polymerase